MEAILQAETTGHPVQHLASDGHGSLDAAIANSWSKIAPFWPLKNLIAVNPIAGFEDLPFEEALTQANAYFQQRQIPAGMEDVNRESIKWLQAFFDDGQATFRMPLRNQGLLKSTLHLIRFDGNVHHNDQEKIQWLLNLPKKPESVLQEGLSYLGIGAAEQEQFLTLMLTTLPGWAAHVQYRTNWADAQDEVHPNTVTQTEYLAFRMVLTCLIWREAKELIQYHSKALATANTAITYDIVENSEAAYQAYLTQQLKVPTIPATQKRANAQLVFCIDVRSEPFRRALEAQGDNETFGFAGFFGLPVSIHDPITGAAYASCPVLLKPAYNITETPAGSAQSFAAGYKRTQGLKRIYQSLKYTFSTPFSLVETIGLASGLWMGIRSLSPSGAAAIQATLKQSIAPGYAVTTDISTIPIRRQVAFAAGALNMIGLTKNFAPLVVFCGHGSATENNAYATALDCGACGGRHGAPNARILAAIMNQEEVRNELRKQHIDIPGDTTFLAAEHNTTTDEVELYDAPTAGSSSALLQILKKDLRQARDENSHWRSSELGVKAQAKQAYKATALRAKDWAQVRPEWGLARNASFIVGPRWLTKNINLEGRSFLHSYEWDEDPDSYSLTSILTAPMVVAQWINAQYFFSTLDNVAFGGGSKITKNITGKIGIMQGNASDLMHGLSLQSVFKADDQPYHKPIRLTVIVYTPKASVSAIVQEHEILKKLFGNGWIHLICFDPLEDKKHKLERDFTWTALNEHAEKLVMQ